MRLSELQNKDIVDIETGKVIGDIVDVMLDLNGNLDSLIVEKKKFLVSMFSSKAEFEVKWDQVAKIVEDVILVRMSKEKE